MRGPVSLLWRWCEMGLAVPCAVACACVCLGALIADIELRKVGLPDSRRIVPTAATVNLGQR